MAGIDRLVGYAERLSCVAGYDNDVCRIAGNVLARFSDPTPFVYPNADPTP